MYEYFNIGEIAGLFQIAPSKLRYWDKEGLIKLARNPHNGYREFSIRQLGDIANIVFYRNLDVSVKELKKLYDMDLADLDNMFYNTDQKLENQLAELLDTKNRVKAKREAIAAIMKFQHVPWQLQTPEMHKITAFSPYNPQHMQSIMHDARNLAAIINLNDINDIQYGVILYEHETADNIIWTRNDSKQYLKFLNHFSPGNIYENNLPELREYLVQNNYACQRIIGRFLISEYGPNPQTYLEAFAELD